MKKRTLALLLAVFMLAAMSAPVYAETEDIAEEVIQETATESPEEFPVEEEAPLIEEEEFPAEEEAPPIEEEEEHIPLETDVITGFAAPKFSVINEEKKPALCALLEQLPEEIGVYLGGTPAADEDGETTVPPEDSVLQSVPVTWECLQDYDEWLTEYEFVPKTEGFQLAAGVDAPVITLTVEDLSTPAGGHILTGELDEVPFVGSGDMRLSAGSSYNGYELGNLPPIRDQGSYGTCWAFAAIGGMETDLIADGMASPDTVDLSELHLVYFAYHPYFDPKGLNAGDSVSAPNYLQRGGNYKYAFRSLANMVGPVDESEAPYASAASYAPAETEAKAGNIAQLTGVSLINPADRDAAKAAILQHGSVGASMYHSSAYYSATKNSYYYAGESAPNHDILLVGWDDEFPAESFRENIPEGDGAWLVRNSWGYEGYGFFGYFWISYYDTGILRDVFTAYDAENPLYDHVYAGDTAVGCCGYTYSLSENTTVTQTVSVDSGEAVEAVGIEMDAGSDLSVTVSDGKRTAAGSYSGNQKGYCLIVLEEPLIAAKKTALTVTVTYNGPGRIYFEKPGTRTVFTASCGSGGFVIRKPSGYQQQTDSDASVKLYTSDCSIPTYTVSYDANGGGHAPEAQIKTYDKDLILSTERPDRDGYDFLGWAADRTAAEPEYQPGGLYTDDAPVTLFAVWREKDPVEEFVRRGYLIMLGRQQVTQTELDYYVLPLRARELSAAQMIVNFLSSIEFADRHLRYEEIVTIAYETMMDREPDPDGLVYHTENLRKGISYNALVNNFTGSEEFKEICEKAGGIEPGELGLYYRDQNLSVTAFVIRNYILGLGRAREQISGDELEYYCEILLIKTQTPQQVAHHFVFSDEARSLYPDDRGFIIMLYHLYMDREPGEEEIGYYIELLAAGTSREQVDACFGASDEFAEIVKSYGL